MDMNDIANKTYQMRVTKRFLTAIDDWRRKEPDIPPRAEAIRRLVELGIAAGSTTAQPSAPLVAPGAPGTAGTGQEKRRLTRIESAALRVEVQAAAIAEIERNGRRALVQDHIVRQFAHRGVSAITVFRWVHEVAGRRSAAES
jgi:hypothetical protein